MNSLQNYGSSDSEEDASDHETPEFSKTPEKSVLKQSNAERQIDTSISESATLNNTPAPSKLSYEERIALKVSEFKKKKQMESDFKEQSSKVYALDLFSTTTNKVDQQEKESDFYSIQVSRPEQQPIEIKRPRVELEDDFTGETKKQKINKKNGQHWKDQIPEGEEIIDFQVNDYYNKNKELISQGVLDKDQIIQENSQLKYYGKSTGGTNQLSDVIRFTKQNSDQLQKNVDKEKEKLKQRGQGYGFR